MPHTIQSTVLFSAAKVKPPVLLVIAANGTLATAFAAGQAHQSVVLATNDRIALTAQTTPAENGIYVVQASGAPVRASDLPAGATAAGVSFQVMAGTYRGQIWVCDSLPGSDVVGTSSLSVVTLPASAAAAWGDVTGTLADQTDLQAALDSKAASSHAHAASDITSGTLAHERGGLEADVSAYDGLLRITGGATAAVPVTAFALTVLDDADAATVRATIGAASSAEVTAATSGYSRRSAVIARVDNTAAPPTEVSGDRYLLDATGASHANWDGAAANDIVEFDGAVWVATSPVEGWIVYSDGSNTDWLYVDDGSPAWQERTSGGGVAWGGVTGTLADQTDLQNALDAKGFIAGQVWTGAHDFGGADSLEIPNGASPTVDAAGEIAVDTTITDMTGLVTYHDGIEQLYAIAVPTAQLASPTDKDAAVYSAADNEFQLQGVVTPYQLNGDTLGGELSGDMLFYDTDHWENVRAGNEHDRLEIRSGVPTWFPRYASTTVSDGATVTVDQSVGDEFKVTLGGNRTLALTNPTLDQSVMLRVIQDGTGSRTLSYPASVKWPSGTAPTLTTTAGASDWLGFKCVDAGTPVYHGFVVGQGYSA